MKNLILILLLSVISTTISVSADAATAPKYSRDDIKNMVVKAIDYPQAAKARQLQGDVVVSFSPNGQGKLEVNEIFGGIPELKAYVSSKISSLQLPQNIESGIEPIVLRFRFKLL
jgi:hypothetical protein